MTLFSLPLRRTLLSVILFPAGNKNIGYKLYFQLQTLSFYLVNVLLNYYFKNTGYIQFVVYKQGVEFGSTANQVQLVETCTCIASCFSSVICPVLVLYQHWSKIHNYTMYNRYLKITLSLCMKLFIKWPIPSMRSAFRE